MIFSRRRKSDPPGYYQGKHTSEFGDEIQRLKRAGDGPALVDLLQHLVNATEAESKATGHGVAPSPYNELAIEYRKHKDYAAEVAILERYARAKHAPGVAPAQLAERLTKARALLNDQKRS